MTSLHQTDALAQPANTAAGGPLLSVVVLLEPDGLGLLEDLLTCLDAQTIADFEVVVVPGALAGDELERLSALIAHFGERLSARTKIERVRSTSRAVRLNAGVDAATGRYFVPMRGDTVLFARWAEELAALIAAEPEVVVRAVTVEQDFSSANWPGGRAAYVAVAGPRRRSAEPFSFVSELVNSPTPLGSYALPNRCFSELGFRYEEQLGDAADWELFLHAARACGVVDIEGDVSVLLRHWTDASRPNEARAATRRAAVLDHLGGAAFALLAANASIFGTLALSLDDVRQAHSILEVDRDDLVRALDAAEQEIARLRADLADRVDGVAVDHSAQADASAAELVAVQAQLADLARVDELASYRATAATYWAATP